MAAEVENWDDDLDLNGHDDLFAQSVSTVQTSMSSRMSITSESNLYDEDWKVQMTGNDHVSVNRAIQSAKAAGVPIPHNVPSSALIGGSIKRLGKKTTRPRIDAIGDDWGDDLDLPASGGLVITPNKAPLPPLSLPATNLIVTADTKAETDDVDLDDFDSDWADGNLGIRLDGTKKIDEATHRNPSTIAMSPSLGSQTAESEDDDLRGLELPEGPVDLQALFKTRQAVEATRHIESTVLEQPTVKPPIRQAPFLKEDDDFFNELEVGGGELLDNKKLTLHKNVKQTRSRPNLHVSSRTPTTTLTFTADKSAATRIPRPVPSSVKHQEKQPPLRLAPVMESGDAIAHVTRSKFQPTTTHAQLLRSKRSMPVLRHQPPLKSQPSSNSNAFAAAAIKGAAHQLRRESDLQRAQSPPPVRPLSRLSIAHVPDTPSRTSRRPDFAPKDLLREAAAKKTVTRPQRKRFYGDGTELEIFDDLPTSAAKECKFVKQPSLRGPRTMRSVPSRLNLREQASDPRISILPDRANAGPQTPRSPLKIFQEHSTTPRYLRDTAASRIARESRLAHGSHSRPRGEGPLMPVTTNWKAQVAARSPHASPSAQRNQGKRVQPGLIRPGDAAVAESEKGMTYNPISQRWEGNENVLGVFDFPLPPTVGTVGPAASEMHVVPAAIQPVALQHLPVSSSPPRPALIAPMSAGTTQTIQVVGGMVFDPARMCWLKFKPADYPDQQVTIKSGSNTMTEKDEEEDEEDPFAGIDDLKDAASNNKLTSVPGAAGSKTSLSGLAGDEWLVGEEFDLGPEFIKRQKDEEVNWRRRCESWYPSQDEPGPRFESQAWRWTIREIVGVSV